MPTPIRLFSMAIEAKTWNRAGQQPPLAIAAESVPQDKPFARNG
jgi:hypothetical protein